MTNDFILELVKDGKANVVVVSPDDGSYDQIARRIVEAMQARLGVDVEMISHTDSDQRQPVEHSIALGCLADNQLIASAYYRFNTLVDRWYPGRGGWVMQTIISPERPGEHLLVLGGSTADEVGEAAERFIQLLQQLSDGRLPWQLEVQLGEQHLPLPADRMDCLGTAASEIPTAESSLPETPYQSGFTKGSPRDHLLRLGMYGPHADNMHLSRSSQLGLRYLYTGCHTDSIAYRSVLLEEVKVGVVRTLYHYKSLRMFQLWAQLRYSPVFDDVDRRVIDDAVRDYLLHTSGIASKQMLLSASDGVGIFSRHIACDALNLWAGTDWLWRFTGESQWLQERAIADRYFEAQAGTDVPLTGLTEGYSSYLEVVLEWMLLCCPERIATDPHIKVWTRRVMGLCTNTGQSVLGPQTDASRYPYNLLRKLAFLLDDGGCLFVADLRHLQVLRGMDRVLQFSAGQAYAGDIISQTPTQDVGLIVHPMNERLRRWKAPSIAPAAGFDRIVGRGGWQIDDDYLLLIGVRSGGKSLPNVGNLAAYERFGERLITSHAVPLYPRSGSAWRHSTVTLTVGGRGTGIAEGAPLLSQSDLPEGRLISFCVDTNEHCWTRHLFWRSSAFLFVVDQVHVHGDESFMVSANWRCGGPLVDLDGQSAAIGIGVTGERARFYVETGADTLLSHVPCYYPPLGMATGSEGIDESMLHVVLESNVGSSDVALASLLHAVEGVNEPAYHLDSEDDNWVVTGPSGVWRVGITDAGNELVVEALNDPKHTTPIRRQAASPAGDDRSSSVKAPSATGYCPESLPIERTEEAPAAWRLDLPNAATCWTQIPGESSVEPALGVRTSGDHTHGKADSGERAPGKQRSPEHDTPTRLVIGTRGGDVVIIDNDGIPTWTAHLDTPITALNAAGADLLVGTEGGQVCRFSSDGQIIWSYDCQFRVERDFWPWWFLPAPRVGALVAGKDPESGDSIVAVGTGSTSLNFLDASSGRLLADVVSPYGLPDRIRAHRSSSGLRFLEGHNWLTCGSAIRAWSVPPEDGPDLSYSGSVSPMGRSTDGWDTCGVVDFWVGALEPNIPDVVIVLRHGAVNQVTAYSEASGEPLWDLCIGGSPVALGVTPGADARSARCYVAEQFGWLTVIDGTGQCLGARRVDVSLLGMSVSASSDRVDTRIVAWSKNRMHLINPHEIAGSQIADNKLARHETTIGHEEGRPAPSGPSPSWRIALTGTPLGWIEYGDVEGMLCMEAQQLVLRTMPA